MILRLKASLSYKDIHQLHNDILPLLSETIIEANIISLHEYNIAS